jgi:hypothetical protein
MYSTRNDKIFASIAGYATSSKVQKKSSLVAISCQINFLLVSNSSVVASALTQQEGCKGKDATPGELDTNQLTHRGFTSAVATA